MSGYQGYEAADQEAFEPNDPNRAKLDEYFEKQRLKSVLGKEIKGSGNTFSYSAKVEKKKKGPSNWSAIADQMEGNSQKPHSKNKRKCEESSDMSAVLRAYVASTLPAKKKKKKKKGKDKKEKKHKKKKGGKDKKDKKRSKKKRRKYGRKGSSSDTSSDSDSSSSSDENTPSRRISAALPPGRLMTDEQKREMVENEKKRVAEELATERWSGQAGKMLTGECSKNGEWPKYKSCPLRFLARHKEVAWEYVSSSGQVRKASRIGCNSFGSSSDW